MPPNELVSKGGTFREWTFHAADSAAKGDGRVMKCTRELPLAGDYDAFASAAATVTCPLCLALLPPAEPGDQDFSDGVKVTLRNPAGVRPFTEDERQVAGGTFGHVFAGTCGFALCATGHWGLVLAAAAFAGFMGCMMVAAKRWLDI